MNQTTPAAPAIEVAGFSYSFKSHRALDNVSFRVDSGSLHGFVGPNGAGKTTTLKAICTLLRPQNGGIRVFGHDVAWQTAAVRRLIGFMPDHFSMYRQMTVYEYLDFFGAAYGLSVVERDRVIGDVLALTDMSHRRNDLISGLSRGMQQRVSLARVLVNDPALLLLDEPASGLDPRARIELMEILRELQRLNKTIFISSHILAELAELCDSVTIIDRGRIKYSGRMDDLPTGGTSGAGSNGNGPAGESQRIYLLTLAADAPDTAERLAQLPGVVEARKNDNRRVYRIAVSGQGPDDPNALLRGVLELGLPIAAFSPAKKQLNEAFLDLTEQGVR
jgi:ABC-2 type transport system ATP-binding protein